MSAGARVSGMASEGEAEEDAAPPTHPRVLLSRTTSSAANLWRVPPSKSQMNERDGAAIAAVQAGDPQAFRALVDAHGRYVFHVAHRLTGNASDAEDVVQETFLKAYRQLGRFEARADFRTWLHRIAVNCAVDLIRARRSRETAREPLDADGVSVVDTVASPAPAPDRLAMSGEILERVRAGMSCLTPLERAAFMLRHVEGRSIDEIGSALGLRTNATKHSVFRAVRKLRAVLDPCAAPRMEAAE